MTQRVSEHLCGWLCPDFLLGAAVFLAALAVGVVFIPRGRA